MSRHKPSIVLSIALFSVLWFAAGTASLWGQSRQAENIIRRAEQSVYPDAFTMRMKMVNMKSGSVESTMNMQVIYKRNVGTRIEILSPARSRGMRFLQKNKNLWMFNPQAGGGQAIRLSPRASFQGSALSNRDVGDPQFSLEYDAHIVGNKTLHRSDLGDVKTIVIEGTAKNERAAYSKIKLWVRASDDMMLRSQFYAKSGLLFKTAEYTGIRRMAGALRPTIMTMKSMDRPDRKTVVTITDLKKSVSISNAAFTLAVLTR